VTFGNHLVERKGLKQVERKGLKEGFKVSHKLSPSLESINQIISSEYQGWFFLEGSLLPSVGACRLCVGKLSVVLRRLTWKWLSEGHLRCLVEAIKRVDQEKQATPKREQIIGIQVVTHIWCSQASIDR
jgi:hypothetical protein